MLRLSRRAVVTGYVALFILVLSFCFVYTVNDGSTLVSAESWSFAPSIVSHGACGASEHSQQYTITGNITRPVRRRNIAIASVFGFHFDVYMALAWTFQRVLSKTPGVRVRVFAESFRYGFEHIVPSMGLADIERHGQDELLDSLRIADEDFIDLLILGTCEIDMREMHAELLAIWNERPDDKKFDLVCMVHNTMDLTWQRHIPEWSSLGALRFITLGDHVGVTFKETFDQFAESDDPAVNSVGYEGIGIDAHYPVLNISELPLKHPNRTLSKAVIQGSFASNRRNYARIFADLIISLHEDAAAWGYQPLADGKSFLPNYESPQPPFSLVLVGSGVIEVPDELTYMVILYRDLDYEDFYQIIADSDLVVPAFSSWAYYREQASSTVALAVELDVPILATERMRQAYGYIDDDRVVVTRPAAVHEVHALKALRTGNASFFLNSDSATPGRKMSDTRGMEAAVQRMLQKGWTRSKEEVSQFKQELWQRNEVVVERLIRDL